MNRKVQLLSAAIVLALFAGAAVYFYIDQKGGIPKINSFEDCAGAGYPIMESYPRQCRTPDGRNFVENIQPQPTPQPQPKPGMGVEVSLRAGQRDGSLLVQKIYPTYITGLNYREYPLATSEGTPVTLYIGDTASNGCTITMKLTQINGSVATFLKTTENNRPCPICLAENTLIDTPSGKIAVQNLKEGTAVWTANKSGEKVAVKILRTSKAKVPADHQVVHLKLSDGRELLVSPGHPTKDDRAIGDLIAGDLIDGGSVISAGLVAYKKDFTYDLLPAGETGTYWANGILVGSTLSK